MILTGTIRGFLFWGIFIAIRTRVVAFNAQSSGSLTIQKSGLMTVQTADTLLRFYLVLANGGNEIIDEIYTRDAHCCLYEPLPDGTNNCIRVDLLGDQWFNLQPEHACTLMPIYPTLYIFDRKGQCKFELEYKRTGHPPASLTHIIDFDTSHIGKFWMPNALKAWLIGYEDCDSIDHDRRRSCHPVDCALKYQGQRNFYNATSKRCEPLTLCWSDGGLELPNVAFRRRWNSCKNLDVQLTDEDIRNFEEEVPSVQHDPHDPLILYQYVCMHGTSRRDNSGCVCEHGWTTNEQDYMSTNPDTQMIHMCDVPLLTKVADLRNKHTRIALIVLGSLCGGLLTMVAALSFLTWWRTHAQPEQPRHDDYEKRPLYPATISMGSISDKNSKTSLHKFSTSSLFSLKESSYYQSARVHTPNMPLTNSELDLRVGDVVTDLKETSVPGMWKGTCHGLEGTFPVCCAELYKYGHGPKP